MTSIVVEGDVRIQGNVLGPKRKTEVQREIGLSSAQFYTEAKQIKKMLSTVFDK